MSERLDSTVPLISVALCTYNGTRYLREQLDSVLSQTYRNLEIVVVDDGSTDETPALLKEYAQQDSRIRIVLRSVNVGFRSNFSHAMSLCTGDFIAPCDQDDIWLENKLRVLLDGIGPNSLIFCDSELIAANGQTLSVRMSDRWTMQDIGDPVALVMTNCVSGHALLFRRTLLQNAPPVPPQFFHDWWLAALAASRDKAVYCPHVLVRYRQHGGNVTDVLRVRDSRASKPPGHGWVRFDDIGSRIASLAGLGGASRELLDAWRRLWLGYGAAWLAWRLPLFMFTHRRRIYALSRHSPAAKVRRALSHVVGMRLKRQVRKVKYVHPVR